MLRRVLLATAATLAILPGTALAKDYAGTALNIIPSGQPGGVPVPPGADQQALMYDGLTPLFNQVTAPDLTKYFKSEALGAPGSPGPTRVEKTPRKGLSIVRDAFDVPHITGKTRDDVIWGAGWVLEEDRALLLAQGRYPARMAALDAPGIDAFSLVTGLKTVKVTKQADRIINREQTRALRRQGKEGRALLHDIDVYVKGINARLRFEKSKQKPFTRVDIYAVNALAGQIFGQGGGDEVRRSELLSGLQKRLGAAKGRQVWNDLTEHDDRDAPVSINRRYPYEQDFRGSSGNAVIDNGSTTNGKAIALSAKVRRYASNFLMVGGSRSTNGHPLFVAGPQIGYFYPGLTLEMDLKGPGIEARGAAMPGGPGDILIGRGPDFAWSLTSAGSDTNDQFVETLCGGSKVKYRYKGKCRKMGRVDAGTVSGVGRVVYRTTVHGPVQGYAKVNGKRVAISFARSSHGRDILWQIMFRRLSDGKVSGVKSFYNAAATSPFTFNVGYADDKNIAMYSAGRLPLRDKRVDPRLPTKGTGQYEWKGFLKPNEHPHVANPASGTLTNWNNKPAPGFGSSDSEWTYGSIQRVQLLNAGLATQQKHDLASVTSAMNAAATEDLRVDGSVFDGLLGVLNSPGPAPSARDQQMIKLLSDWRSQGGSRLDRDLDGKMDAGGAPAIMDALYPKVADAVLSPVLGPQLGQLTTLEGASNSPRSGFTGGRINFVDKDLRQLVGQTFKSPFKTRFCGGGDLATCRASLWAAVDAAGNELAAAQGSEDPNAWTSDANAERIKFAPGLLQTTIRYTNRPSGIQQVISFTGHRPKRK
jgi:acyl-homoserine lactone acylase PvdQ